MEEEINAIDIVTMKRVLQARQLALTRMNREIREMTGNDHRGPELQKLLKIRAELQRDFTSIQRQYNRLLEFYPTMAAQRFR